MAPTEAEESEAGEHKQGEHEQGEEEAMEEDEEQDPHDEEFKGKAEVEKDEEDMKKEDEKAKQETETVAPMVQYMTPDQVETQIFDFENLDISFRLDMNQESQLTIVESRPKQPAKQEEIEVDEENRPEDAQLISDEENKEDKGAFKEGANTKRKKLHAEGIYTPTCTYSMKISPIIDPPYVYNAHTFTCT